MIHVLIYVLGSTGSVVFLQSGSFYLMASVEQSTEVAGHGPVVQIGLVGIAFVLHSGMVVVSGFSFEQSTPGLVGI
jgi:hypothetical protein